MEGKREGEGEGERGREEKGEKDMRVQAQEVSKRLVRNGMKTQVSVRGDFYSH